VALHGKAVVISAARKGAFLADRPQICACGKQSGKINDDARTAMPVFVPLQDKPPSRRRIDLGSR
jgi:hypothetical protein